MDNNSDFTPEQQEELLKYREAFRQEWEGATTGANKKERKEKLEDELVELVPDAISALKHDIKFGETASVRQKAYTYVLNAVREDSSAGKINDPLQKLLKEMTAATPSE